MCIELDAQFLGHDAVGVQVFFGGDGVDVVGEVFFGLNAEPVGDVDHFLFGEERGKGFAELEQASIVFGGRGLFNKQRLQIGVDVVGGRERDAVPSEGPDEGQRSGL